MSDGWQDSDDSRDAYEAEKEKDRERDKRLAARGGYSAENPPGAPMQLDDWGGSEEILDAQASAAWQRVYGPKP